MRYWIALWMLALSPVAQAQDATPPPADQALLDADIRWLSRDELKGRAPFSPEYRIAADYVARALAAAGAVPGGVDGSFLQPVPVVRVVPESPGTGTVTRDGKATKLVFADDFLPLGSPLAGQSTHGGDVVFAGHGVVDPSAGVDDYAGLDVAGRIVAVLANVPKGLNSEIAAHFGSPAAKAALAASRGARGILLLIPAEAQARFTPERARAQWERGFTTWARDGVPMVTDPETPVLGFLTASGQKRLFAGSGIDPSGFAAADAAGTPLPRGPVGASLSVTQAFRIESVGTSDNVVAILPGSDPALAAEHVVLTAHLDHVGVKADARPGEDAIYNGAMDNALGVGALIDVAREFQRSGKPPRRSVVLLAVTAEEIGLIGSSYFASHPTVPKASIVADINLDMPVMTFDFVDLVALGGDRSSIGPVAAQVARDLGFALVPDPSPELAFFVRTDHYSFVKQGVPSISLDTGPGGPGQAAITDFLENHYHQPSDEAERIDMAAARNFVRVNYGIARAVADADERPTWNRGDFFGMLYGGPMAK